VGRREALERVAAVLSDGGRFIATTHLRPDGDAVGSLLAFTHGMTALGKTVLPVTEEPIPRSYRFLPGWERVTQPDTYPAQSRALSAGVCLDCDGLDRTGTVAPLIAAAPPLVNIDHHGGIKAFGDVRCILPEASCTGELLMELLVDMLAVPLDRDLATCLLACHIYDTGRFSQSNTTPQAFRNAARLVEAGASVEDLAVRLFATRTYRRTLLRGRALAGAELDADAGIVWSVLSLAVLTSLQAEPTDTDGIVEELRAVDSSRVAALVSEARGGECRISLRSRDSSVDVAGIAARFGGGGHFRAAGCTIEAPLVEATERLLAAIRDALDAAPDPGARADG